MPVDWYIDCLFSQQSDIAAMGDSGMIEQISGSSSLSRDIKLLGGLLGLVIQEQHGDDAFQLVENVRKTARARRSNAPDSQEKLTALIQKTTLEQRRVLIKAFGNYFQLINIAEDQQRIRVLREREAANRLRESIKSAIASLYNSGVKAGAMREILDQLRVRLVLTAHPSEAKRKEVLVKLRSLADMLARLERESLLLREAKTIEAEMAAEIEELWQTKTVRAHQTTVSDEVDFGLYFITSVIMVVSVDIYDALQEALEEYYPNADWSLLPPVLKFASWIGGDRDGNPNVTPEATLNTLETLRRAAIDVYLSDVKHLRDHLTQAVAETEISPALQQALDKYPNDARYSGEPYRQHMHHIYRQLMTDSYRSTDFLDDLMLIYNSLQENKGTRVAAMVIRQLMRKVRLFGLHLTPLEVREDAGLHAAAVDELFRYYGIHDDYLNAPEETKQQLLNIELTSLRPLFPTQLDRFSEATQHVIRTWRMIATAHEDYGAEVIDTVIASMSKQPSDVLTMLLFAHEIGAADHLEIVPLFETIADLRNAPQVMQTLFTNDAYNAHMKTRAAARGRMRQQIMIGYSDSSKDGGYMASNWNLYTAQQKLTSACRDLGVETEFFHGRGGSIGRGGGPTNRAIRSHPPQSLNGGIKITEQGEVIAYRYSNLDIARRHLHQVMHAAILALSDQSDETIDPRWNDAMEKLAEHGRIAYRDFVYETEGFLPYWQAATPINELSQLRISSRPAKRKTKGGFAAMRAIPWVFSWMQSRAIIPSWFGNGTAVERYCADVSEGMAILQTMYQEWSFFRAVIDNAQLDVVKADMGIASLYSALVEDETLRDEIFTRIQHEHSLTYRRLCDITQQPQLLENMTAIRTSIERRNPYVDPLNFIQVELLRDLRQLNETDSTYQPTLEAVLATINGIAAGMKTTG